MISALIFLVMLLPDTERPVLVLMTSFPTARECNEVLKHAPTDGNKYACIKIDLKPDDEGTAI